MGLDFEDPFDEPDTALARDRWDRPLIMAPPDTFPDWPWPPGPNGERKDGLRPYTRTSTLAGELDNGVGLAIWTRRHVALAVARAAEATRALLVSCEYGDKQLDEYIERALEQAKRDEHAPGVKGPDRADWGTAVHRFTEPDSPPMAPEKIRADIDAINDLYERTGWEVVATEVFVVNDPLSCAGTFDHLLRHRQTGVVRLADKKTGDLHPLSMAIQLAVYSGGALYDVQSGRRSSFMDGIDGSYDANVGFIVHAPFGEGKAELVEVDLVQGRIAARLAQTVREYKKNEANLLRLVP